MFTMCMSDFMFLCAQYMVCHTVSRAAVVACRSLHLAIVLVGEVCLSLCGRMPVVKVRQCLSGFYPGSLEFEPSIQLLF